MYNQIADISAVCSSRQYLHVGYTATDTLYNENKAVDNAT